MLSEHKSVPLHFIQLYYVFFFYFHVSWSEFYRFVHRRKGNKENIPAMNDCNGGQITDPVDKANNLNNYYASVFSC